jgi:hypothetical protein
VTRLIAFILSTESCGLEPDTSGGFFPSGPPAFRDLAGKEPSGLPLHHASHKLPTEPHRNSAMLEQYAFYLLLLGVSIGCISWLWLIVAAFKTRWPWGVAVLLFPPSALIFVSVHFRRARGPLLVLVLAGLIFATPYGLSYYERKFGKWAPYEQVVNGEVRLTLTDVPAFDYSSLQSRSDVVVLQMANADVTDQTLDYLSNMSQLRNLDLNGSQITDEGLKRLVKLPRLQELRLARTQITDDGFRQYLAPKESLLRLDLTGTAVKSKTKRDWKKANPTEREYVD